MILALDTSGSNCGVALWGGSSLRFREIRDQLRHNEVLLTLIEEIFLEADCNAEKITGIAVTSGPGSFTGLRVGVATAKALSWCWGKPLFMIPTLSGLAAATPDGIPRVLALMPARAREVYAGAFQRHEGGWIQICKTQVCSLDSLPHLISGEVHLCGEGYMRHQRELDAIFRKRILPLPENKERIPLAVITAQLAAERLQRGESDDLYASEPEYCYPFPRKTV
jgi:tRNA threonylcarbamoyladenosine biosynthesis protein TsaB